MVVDGLGQEPVWRKFLLDFQYVQMPRINGCLKRLEPWIRVINHFIFFSTHMYIVFHCIPSNSLSRAATFSLAPRR